MKRSEDVVLKKQRSRERELERLKREEERERFQRSALAFDTWKHLKDVEREADRGLRIRQQRFMTPTMRGIIDSFHRRGDVNK